MALSSVAKTLAGALVASAVSLAAAADEAAALAAIAAHCERCHPKLPAGGWQVMTARPMSRDALAGALRRMEEEYSAFPGEAEKTAIIDYLAAR